MRQKIVKVIKLLVYASFFVPLVVIPKSYIFPFIVPKILLFRSLVLLMLAGYVVLLIINWQEYKPRFSWLNLALTLFFASFAVSTFVGVDPYHSFWDNHERMLGLFTLFHYVVFYFITSALFKTWEQWRTAMRVFLIAGSVVMFIGFLQKVADPQLLLNQGSDRVASTLGNPIYVGGYGLFLFFLALLLFLKEQSSGWRWVQGVLGVLAVLVMFYSGTRGSILGFFAGVGVLVPGFALALKNSPRTRRTLWVVMGAMVLLLAVLYTYRTTEFVTSIPAVGRTLNTSLTDLKHSNRFIAWGVAYQSWKEYPVFGWGPNNFFYAFNKHYNPRSLEFGFAETWFDNAHNIIMNTLTVQGIVGLVIYLALFVIAIGSLVAAHRRRENVHLLVVGTAFLIAHLVQNVTVFENPTSYLYFMFWLAMINRLTQPEPVLHSAGKKPVTVPDRALGGGALAVLSAVALLLIFIFNVQPARANKRTLAALKVISSQPAAAEEIMKEALSFSSPHIDDIRSDIGRTTAQVLTRLVEQDKATGMKLFDIVYPDLRRNLQLHPLDIRNHLTLFQLGQLGYMLTNDPNYIGQSGQVMEEALVHSPKRQQLMYNMANFKLQIGQANDAITLLEQAIRDNPKIAESYWRLAYTYKTIGNHAQALATLELIEKNGANLTRDDQAIIDEVLSSLTTTPATTTTGKK